MKPLNTKHLAAKERGFVMLLEHAEINFGLIAMSARDEFQDRDSQVEDIEIYLEGEWEAILDDMDDTLSKDGSIMGDGIFKDFIQAPDFEIVATTILESYK
jgi:hypothetical protein